MPGTHLLLARSCFCAQQKGPAEGLDISLCKMGFQQSMMQTVRAKSSLP